jgi:hypothetical protein
MLQVLKKYQHKTFRNRKGILLKQSVTKSSVQYTPSNRNTKLSVTALPAITYGVWVICSLITNKHWQILYTIQITAMSTSSAQHALVSSIHHHKQRKTRQSTGEKNHLFFLPITSFVFLSPSLLYPPYLFITFSINPPVSHSIHQRISPSDQDTAFQKMKTTQQSVPCRILLFTTSISWRLTAL